MSFLIFYITLEELDRRKVESRFDHVDFHAFCFFVDFFVELFFESSLQNLCHGLFGFRVLTLLWLFLRGDPPTIELVVEWVSILLWLCSFYLQLRGLFESFVLVRLGCLNFRLEVLSLCQVLNQDLNKQINLASLKVVFFPILFDISLRFLHFLAVKPALFKYRKVLFRVLLVLLQRRMCILG